jgi:hypothetical protein
MKKFYMMKIAPFVAVVEEQGLEFAVGLARQALQEDLIYRREEVDKANRALKNTIDLLERLSK